MQCSGWPLVMITNLLACHVVLEANVARHNRWLWRSLFNVLWHFLEIYIKTTALKGNWKQQMRRGEKKRQILAYSFIEGKFYGFFDNIVNCVNYPLIKRIVSFLQHSVIMSWLFLFIMAYVTSPNAIYELIFIISFQPKSLEKKNNNSISMSFEKQFSAAWPN